jgi:hypothetical protein
MSGRPWLKALKEAMRERSAATDEISEKISEGLPPEGCERCKSPTEVLSPVMNRRTAEKVRDSWGEEERRLIAAGWEPKRRCGKIIWKHPDSGFYVSQEVATHFLSRELTTLAARAGQTKRGNTTG